MNAPRVAFLFSTRGPGGLDAGAALLRTDPAFRRVLCRCDTEIRRLLGWSLVAELRRDGGAALWTREDRVEPALVAVQLALCAAWRARGVRPSAVGGLSAGEIAAGAAAGALSARGALRLACAVARVLRGGGGAGRMLVCALEPEAADALCREAGGAVWVGVEYGPGMTVLSGEAQAVERCAALLAARGARAWPTPSTFALHSPLWSDGEPAFLHAAASLRLRAPAVPCYSSAAAGRVEGTPDGGHWWSVLHRRASWAAAARAMLHDGCTVFVEIGPHPTLSWPLQQTATLLGRSATVLPSMVRGLDPRAVLDESAAALRALGVPVCAPGSIHPSTPASG